MNWLKKYWYAVAVVFIPVTATVTYFIWQWFQRRKFSQPDTTTDTPQSTDMAALDYRGNTSLPLGLQNNNPGNLRPNGDPWQGWVDTWTGSTGSFMIFNSLRYGIRAAAKNIATLVSTYKTIRAYVTVYAPPSENDTAAYIANVSAATGIEPDTPIQLSHDTLKALLLAHFDQEDGTNTVNANIPDSEIEAGLSLTPYGKSII